MAKKVNKNPKETKKSPDKKIIEFESTPFKWYRDENDNVQLIADPNLTSETIQPAFNSLMGVKDNELGFHILSRGERALSPFLSKDESQNVLAQSLNDLQPNDAIESRLAVQAAIAFVYLTNCLRVAGSSDMLCHTEPMMNLAIKLMRVHNETIETLSKYRRGGEQRVIIQHQQVNVSGQAQAVVGNFQSEGGGGNIKKQGDISCQQYAEPKQEPTAIDHAVSPQWPMGDVGSTEDCAQAPKQKKASAKQS